MYPRSKEVKALFFFITTCHFSPTKELFLRQILAEEADFFWSPPSVVLDFYLILVGLCIPNQPWLSPIQSKKRRMVNIDFSLLTCLSCNKFRDTVSILSLKQSPFYTDMYILHFNGEPHFMQSLLNELEELPIFKYVEFFPCCNHAVSILLATWRRETLLAIFCT